MENETNTCFKCHQPAPRRTRRTRYLWCWRCTAALLKKQHVREAQLAREPRMTWPEFVSMLSDYGFLASLTTAEFEWSWAIYQQYGRHLGASAGITECAELEHEYTLHTYLGAPGCVPIVALGAESALSWELDNAAEQP